MSVEPRDTSEEPSSRFVQLRHQREAADRAYNAALTALDRALQRARTFSSTLPVFDESQVAALNERWSILPSGAGSDAGWLGRLRSRIWGTVRPLFERQQAFNATLVDHLNRNTAAHRQTAETLQEMAALYRDEIARLTHFQALLVQYAQTITGYVDTKDRVVEAQPHALEAATHALTNAMEMRWESMLVRDQRRQAEVDELRMTLGVAHRAILTLKREIETRRPAVAAADTASPVATREEAVTVPPSGALDAYKYVGFEDQFRGSQADIRERIRGYVQDFAGCEDVLDIGCGRGEFLDLLREHHIRARGVDLNSEMVEVCRGRGLEAEVGDALSYLLAQRDESLGGVFGAQVAEHLEPDYLLRLLDAAQRKLRPGGVLILETINPACWFAFFSSYIRDITHVRPLHPDTLRYLVIASGFQHADVRYLSPFPEASKLQPVVVPEGDPLAAAAAVLNENTGKINGLLFSFLDYAIVARRS